MLRVPGLRPRGRAAGLLMIALALLGAGCGGAQARPQPVRLAAGPPAAAFVTPVHISVSGLPPGGLVTLRARASDFQGRPWASAAQFLADASGDLNLASAVPVSGSYHAADAAGLLWSLAPARRPGRGADRRLGRRRAHVHSERTGGDRGPGHGARLLRRARAPELPVRHPA